ncbi:MAG: NAD-dependent epimerase/dehydratase family protein [Candidatus Geothermincolia bacterium]
MKKALVTGAAGFIGSNVVRELLSEDVEVRAMVLPGEDQRNLDNLDVEKVEGNVLDPASLDSALAGCDTLFHLAAVYALWAPDRRIFYDVNLQGSRNMLWAARRADIEKVVYTSSIAALGVRKGKLPSDEETAFNQYHRANDYVLTKHISQEEALTFAREGMPIVVVNPCFPYGEGDVGPTPTGRIILDVANRVQFMTYEGGINVVDVKDVARGHVLAARKGRIGEKYILGNRNVTMKELFELVAATAGVETRIIKMPLPLTLLYGYLWKKLADITGNQPTTTHHEVAYSNQYLFYDVSKAQRELGLELTPLEVTLRRSLDWFERNGYIPRTGPLVRFTSWFERLPFMRKR